MKNKLFIVCLAALTLSLASLFGLSLRVAQGGYANLLMVKPRALAAPGMNAQRLEEFSEEEFLLTYEIYRHATAQGINSSHSVALVGTNHNYVGIMGYPLLDGGFFTKAATDSKSRQVVLNETAAFQIFGSDKISGVSLRLNGETWIVTGVIRDNDTENPKLYALAAITGGQPESIMVLMDKTVTEAYVKNALKSIGVHDNSYDFINLSKSAKAFDERFSVAWKVLLSAGIMFIAFMAGGRLRETLRLYRAKAREMYLGELFTLHRVDLLKAVCGILALALGITAVLILSLDILGTCLAWRELTPVTGGLLAGDFGGKLLALRNCEVLGRILFWICVCLVLFCLVKALGKNRPASLPDDKIHLFGDDSVEGIS